ncbi:unnamed protein product [Amaranthus hypochondriacus]
MNRRLLSHLSQLSADDNHHLLHWHYSEFDDHNFQIHGQTLFYLFILFSIILLVTLLLLYARWYFRFRHVHHAHYPHVPHAPSSRAVVCRGLDPVAIKSMPIILHQRSTVGREDEMECCICLGVFEEGDKVKVLPKCDHRFHSDCVDRWLSTQSSCPLCRLSFRVESATDSVVLEQV